MSSVCRKIVVPGLNDLATTHPHLAEELVDQSLATRLTFGVAKRVRWRCQKKHEWNTKVYVRTLLGAGCPDCAKYGFSMDIPAIVYLVCSPEDDAETQIAKVGVSNTPKTRVFKHRRNRMVTPSGGTVALFSRGEDARSLEKLVLQCLTSRGVLINPAESRNHFDGYTETFHSHGMPLDDMESFLQYLEIPTKDVIFISAETALTTKLI